MKLIAKLMIVSLAVLLLTACGAGVNASTDSPVNTSNNTSSQNPNTSSSGFKLTVPEYLELENVGDTYQIEPEVSGFESPEYTYVSESPDMISVSESGLITVETIGIVKITVIAKESGTNQSVSQEMLVVAGDVKAKANSSSS